MQTHKCCITPAREVNTLTGRGETDISAPLTKTLFLDLRDKKLDR
jgi:hypothetical protein